MKESLVGGDISALPPPFGLKVKPPCPRTLDLALIEHASGHFTLCKIVNFRDRVIAVEVERMLYGRAHVVDCIT